MSKYDYSKVSREALEELARASHEYAARCCDEQEHTHFSAIRGKIRQQAQVKTRAEYDREIGEFLRAELQVNSWDKVYLDRDNDTKLRALVNASRSAPEGE